MAIFDRMAKVLNAFRTYEQSPPTQVSYAIGPSTSAMPHTPRRRYSSERSIISAIYTRLSIDVAGVSIRHTKIDENERYSDDISSALNRCLMLEANLDQSPRAFRQDIVMTLLDKGTAAIVPVDTTRDQQSGELLDIYTLRVGEITAWYPNHVRVSVYNEKKGIREEIVLEKRSVAIVENPFYSVMNEPNSTLQRLIRKLNLLDEVDEDTASRKLDLIIQLPYVIKTEARKAQAEQRRQDIEFQLKNSQYGIAYTDGTEKVTQLNRPAENHLLEQIQFLIDTLYEQLSISKDIMSGTADEKVMLNYRSRTLEPILDAIVEAMQRSFLGIKGTMDMQKISYFQDPFKLVPISEIAVIADKFSRNEILSANEIRSYMGIPPSQDPKAEELHNSNMPTPPDSLGEGLTEPTEEG